MAALSLDRASSCQWLGTSLVSPLRFLHSCTTVAQLRRSLAKVCVSKLLYGLPVLLHTDMAGGGREPCSGEAKLLPGLKGSGFLKQMYVSRRRWACIANCNRPGNMYEG